MRGQVAARVTGRNLQLPLQL